MEQASERPAPSRGRHVAARILVVLAAVLGLVSLVAGYVRFQALDPDTFRGTADQLITDDEIRAQVAGTLVDELYANVDVAAALEEQLPAEQQGLAGPLAGAMRELTDRAALRFFDRPEVQELWVDTAAFSHQQLLNVLNDDVSGLETDQGAVFLDLRPLIIELGNRVALVARVAERLPDDAGRIKVVEAGQLETAQNVTHALDVLGRWLWVVPLLLFATALWLGRGERLSILRWTGVAAIVTGLVVLIGRNLAGDYVVDQLARSDAAEPAAHDAWTILTDLLADGGRSAIGFGIIVLFAAWLAGASSTARSTRRELAPLTARPELAYGAAVALFVGLLLWAPTAQTTRVPLMIAAAIILAIGVEALRRQTAREHPGARADNLGEYARAELAKLRGTPA